MQEDTPDCLVRGGQKQARVGNGPKKMAGARPAHEYSPRICDLPSVIYPEARFRVIRGANRRESLMDISWPVHITCRSRGGGHSTRASPMPKGSSMKETDGVPWVRQGCPCCQKRMTNCPRTSTKSHPTVTAVGHRPTGIGQLPLVNRQLWSVYRRLLSIDRQLLSVDRQLPTAVG